MTPAERQALLRDIGRVIDEKLAPVAARVSVLEQVDREHEGAIREQRAELRKSNTEHKVATNEALMAASRHIAAVLQEVRDDIRQSVAPRAIGAEAAAVAGAKAAVKAEGKVDALAIDATKTKSDAHIARRWSKLGPLLVVIIQAIVTGIFEALRK